MTLTIERIAIGKAKIVGKRCHYRFIVEGVELGIVKGGIQFGGGNRADAIRRTGYVAGGLASMTSEDAERHLLVRQFTLVNSRMTDVQKDKVRTYLEAK